MRALALLLPLLVAPRQDGTLAREWRVRHEALAPRATEAELARGLRGADWRERAAALEALARALPSEVPEELLGPALAALDDPHPNPRAAAVRVAALHRRAVGAATLERLARDVFPEVRVELAPLAAPAADEALLRALWSDPDPRVARAAAVALLRAGRAEGWWRETEPGRDEASWCEALELVLRAGADAAFFSAGRAAERDATRATLWEAAAAVSCGACDAAVLLDGFARAGLPREEESGAAPRWRRRLLLEAAHVLGEEVGGALLARAASAGEGPAAELLLEAALEALPPAALARQALALELPDALAVALWDGLLGRADGYERELLRAWLARAESADLRAAVVDVAAEVAVRTGDVGSCGALADVMAGADDALADDAFRALCDVPDPGPWLAALHERWLAGSGAERKAELRLLPRAPALVPFRAELLWAWGSGEVRAPAVLELLGAFEGDAGVIAELGSWLEDELVVLERVAPPDEDETRGPWREAEERARSLARALHRAAGPAAVPVLGNVLRRVAERSKEVSKACVALLGKEPAGRAWLASAEWLDAAPHRVRIETALVGGDGARVGAAYLAERYETCDEELRLRILAWMGERAEPVATARLRDVAADAGHSAAERVVALGELARGRPPADAARALADVVERAPDLEVERAALEALARVDDPSGPAAALAHLRGPERAALFRDELLLALARDRADGWRARCAAEWLARPLAHAAEELRQRYLSRRLPSREFAYRGELWATAELAAAGELEALLAAADDWWRCDGRLLLAMAQEAAAAGAPDGARELYHAALVALAGEAPADDGPGHRMTARAGLLELALDARRWVEAAHWASELEGSWASGVPSARSWLRVFGLDDRRAGRDSHAWLAATRAQCLARAALEDGDAAAARDHAARARALLRDSRLAERAQRELEAALD